MTERRKFEIPARRAGKTERQREAVKEAIEQGKQVSLPSSPPIADFGADGETFDGRER